MSEPRKPTDAIFDLVEEISPILRGRGTPVQAAALTELFAMWIAGWPDFMRDQLIEEHAAFIREQVPILERLIHGPNGHPDNIGESHANRNDPAGPDIA